MGFSLLIPFVAEAGKHARTDEQLRDADDVTCPNHYHVVLVMYVIEERHSPSPRQYRIPIQQMLKATLFCTLAVALLPSTEAADACGGCKTMIDQFKSVRAQQETLNHGFVSVSFLFFFSLLPFSLFF